MSLYRDTREMGSPPPFDVNPYVTRVRSRHPEWKQHASLKNAKAALRVRRYVSAAEIWQFVDGDWTLIARSVPE